MSKVKRKRIGVIFKRDFNEYRSYKSFKIVIPAFILITIVVCIRALVSGENGEMLKLNLHNTLFLLALIPPLVSIPLFITVPLTRDKSNRTITNLLATPIGPKEIVCGKSLAVFLPSYIISILSPLSVVLVVNYALIIPTEGVFYLPVPLILSVFVITPLLCYGLTKFTIQLSMIKSPELAISPSYLIGLALLIGIPIGSAMNVINLTSWSFMLLYLGVALLMWILVWSFSFLLTKERIILSN